MSARSPTSSPRGTAPAGRPTSPPDRIKSAILASSGSGWSPLRIAKSPDGTSRLAPKKIVHQTPVRRTSSSFSHVRNNNLVSNSPFKLASPGAGTSTLSPKVPSRIPTPTYRRSSAERRISLERRKKPLPDAENTRPGDGDAIGIVRRRQSRGLTSLERAEYVSKSPFRGSVSEPVLSSSSERSIPGHESDTESEPEANDLEDVVNTPRSSAAHVEERVSPRVLPRPPVLDVLSTPVLGQSISPRSNLVSRRLHGPRSTSGGTRRARSKTVTFDERCDVVEFDVESFEADDDDEVFQSDYEVDYDPNRRLNDEEGYDSNASDRDESYMSDPEGERGFVGSLLAQEEEQERLGSRSPSHSPFNSRPTTPPSQVAVPPTEDTEDGIPYGRSHHIDRIRAARSSNSPAGIPPVTPARGGAAFDDRPPSPSPARALPRPPLAAGLDEDEEGGVIRPPGQSRPPLAPLALSPSKERASPMLPLFQEEDPFAMPSIAEMSPNLDGSSSQQSLIKGRKEAGTSPVRRPLEVASSLSSGLESSGSINKASPRITRDEVRKRLLRSKTSPQPGEGGSSDEQSPRSSRQTSPVRQTDPILPKRLSGGTPPLQPVRPLVPRSDSANAVPVAARPVSFDLHQPGVDLGDVRSALDRLMIGVERGFADDGDASSYGGGVGAGGSRDVSFADDTANSSMLDRTDDFDERGDGDGNDEEQHNVFITSHLTAQSQMPAISPPSPLLMSTQMSTLHSDARDVNVTAERASSESTATTDDDNTPETPSGQSSVNAPPVSINAPLDPPMQVHSPFARGDKASSDVPKRPYSGLESRIPTLDLSHKKEKALPATPQPRISLDFEGGFGDFGGVLGFSTDAFDKDTSGKRVPSAQLMPPPSSIPTPTNRVTSASKPALSGKEAIKAHEAAILARRRELRRGELDDGEGLRAEERPQRRRSRSTGDALDVRTERAAADRYEARESGSGIKPSFSHESTSSGAAEPSLSASISKELNGMLELPKDRSYHLRERPETIYAAYDQKVNHHGVAGDVDSGKAWRTVRRPSDMNEYAQEVKAYRSQQSPGKAHGKVFVKVLGVRALGVPIPRLPTVFTCTLNNGIHFVETPECRLEKDSAIDQEFELIEHNKLEFSLTLKVRRDKHLTSQVPVPIRPQPVAAPPPPPVAAPPPQKTGFRFFGSSSPKKSSKKLAPVKAATPPPAPPPVQQYHPAPVEDGLVRWLKADGTLGRTFIAFKDVAPHCDTYLFETAFDLISAVEDRRAQASGQQQQQQGKGRKIGEIVLQMFRLPPLPDIPPDDLPQSLEECLRGMRHINWHKVLYHEGVLTQNGGDCKSWRRRQFRVVGAQLISFNDVTKKATATIELKKAVGVHDDNDPEASSTSLRKRASDSYDAIFKVERSFRLLFPDDEEIEFFADTDDDKARWLHIFRALVGRIPPKPLWAELVWQRQQDLALESSMSLQEQPRSR